MADAQDNDHTVRLRLACYCGSLEIVQELLNRGASASSENYQGENSLHLLSRGEYNSQDDGVCIARELLVRGANVNAQNKHHRTPLHLASYFGRPAITRVLLDHGAKPNAEDSRNEAPLHLLSQGKYSSQDDGVTVARLLLERRAVVNAQDIDLRTPLHHASFNGNVAIAQVLLERGGTPHAGDCNGETPLHLALRGKDDSEEHGIGITRLLLERGADVDAEDDDGETPLGLSLRLRKPKIASTFLEHSAKVDTRNVAKTEARSRMADFSSEVAAKRIRLSPPNHFVEVRGENSRNDIMEL